MKISGRKARLGSVIERFRLSESDERILVDADEIAYLRRAD